jgi:hypothetical protein
MKINGTLFLSGPLQPVVRRPHPELPPRPFAARDLTTSPSNVRQQLTLGVLRNDVKMLPLGEKADESRAYFFHSPLDIDAPVEDNN